jgi:hypothetical protein|uniref:HNH endonuclease n=1 Tax=viral metagenome TaxID=1070528 RepID=A0A6C0BYJ1_9ZZZZ
MSDNLMLELNKQWEIDNYKKVLNDRKQIKIGKEKSIKVNSNLKEYTMNEEKSFVNRIYLNEEFTEKKELEKSLKKKLNSYKTQDIKKERYDQELFIKYNSLVEKLVLSKLKCYYCNTNMKLFYNKKREPTQWTLERINNKEGHTKFNTVCACLKCNLERRTKNSKKFLFTKKMNLIKKL